MPQLDGDPGHGCDPSAAIPAHIMRVKEMVIDEEELIKQRESETD